jgi:predicted O-linked N-acetylglucosamine transferase (SPINDLY family)
MGLPLVTLSGEAFASRMAARLLRAVGADGGITETLEEYVETAVALANDRQAHAAYRSAFSEAHWAESIGNIADFTRQLETALIRIQTHLQAGAE